MALQACRTAFRSLRTGLQGRSLSSSTSGSYEKPAIAKISLENPVPDLPKATYVIKPKIEAKTQVTTLSNGLRVASEPKFGQFCTVGKNFSNQTYT